MRAGIGFRSRLEDLPAESVPKVPKNDERLFGSLHFVPSADPLNAFSAVVPMAGSETSASGWNHCLAPQLGS